MRNIRLLPLLFVIVLLGACGDDDEGNPRATATPTAAPPTATAAPPTATAAPPTATATPTAVLPTPTATFSASPTATPTDSIRPATFTARGSVEQAYVIDAEPGAELRLIDPSGSTVASGNADENGALIFRNVAPGQYRVVTQIDGTLHSSPVIVVRTADDVPDPSFYAAQRINPGYGYLETRDGTLLAINVILPGPVSAGPYPTVIEYSGYDPANPSEPEPSTRVAVALGFAAVGVNMRGTGCSGGVFDYFETLQSTDGYDVVETIAAQPWVRGNKVGLVGISYPGITQLFVAQTRPPSLAAIAPVSVISDVGRGILYPGGILNNGFALDWARARQRDAMVGGQRWSRERMEAGDQICIANQKLRGQTPNIIDKIYSNPFYVPSVLDPISPVTFVDNIHVPVFLAGAWQDEQTGGYFPNMFSNFTGTDRVHFTITNGNHAEPFIPTIFSRWMEFLDFYVREQVPVTNPNAFLILSVLSESIFGAVDLTLDADRFTGMTYEQALAAYESEPKVRILFDNGAGGMPGSPIPGFELTFDSWPIEEIVPTEFYFNENGRLTREVPAGEGADRYVYDPSRSQETSHKRNDGDLWGTTPSWQWEPLEPGKAVAYATDPLEENMIMVGNASVDLWLMSTAPDVDLQATLSEIRPDGKEVYVQDGWLRASRRKEDETQSTVLRPVHTHLESDAEPLPSGEFVRARIEMFPFAHAFRAGSRIRISVQAPGGTRPRWKFDALPANGEVVNTINRSAAMPSRVVLPVLPGVDIPTDYPGACALRGQPCRDYVEWENTPAS